MTRHNCKAQIIEEQINFHSNNYYKFLVTTTGYFPEINVSHLTLDEIEMLSRSLVATQF